VQVQAHHVALIGTVERIFRDCKPSADELFLASLLAGRQRIGQVVMSAGEAPRESKER
jgi:hypothetical protein